MILLIFIVKLILSAGLLYGYYHGCLRNHRFHHYNRFYLLGIVLFSCVIPFLHIPLNLFTGQRQHTPLIQTLKVITAGRWEAQVTVYAPQNQWSKWISFRTGCWLLYAAGVMAGLLMLIRSLSNIRRIRKEYSYEKIDWLKIYQTDEPGTPFSFFKSIFWNKKMAFDDKQGKQIFRHELFHVKEKHSADILFMEIVCCIAWFNPFFHLVKKELKAIHEFLADEYAISESNRYDYAELLVRHAIHQKKSSLVHPFFHHQIKRRITMITQSNLIRRSGYFSRIMALPLLFVLGSAFAIKLKQPSFSGHLSNPAGKTITVVIDAGHGGKFEGSHNASGLVEKDINLSIAQQIEQLSTEYHVNVILTRSGDNLVGNAASLKEDLQNRLDITNEAKADLFVSIHVNATYEKTTARTGFEAYMTHQKEDGQATMLAASILAALKDVYPADETVKQRQEGIQVLDHNSCPAVMIQCGYINNPTDAAFISNKINQEKVARKILEGITQYSNALSNTKTALANMAENMPGNTISAEELTKLNVGDIKSINADLKKTMGAIFFKNGETRYFNIQEIKDYYSNHHVNELPNKYLMRLDMKDSVLDFFFVQDTVPANKTKTKKTVYMKVENEADYPGGQDGWRTYLFKTLKYPQKAVDKELQGTVVVQFIVDVSGKVSDVKAISGPKELQKESVRVIKESGNWQPATQAGIKVRAYKRQPITYRLERQNAMNTIHPDIFIG